MEGVNIKALRHWATFGKRGAPQEARANRGDWKSGTFSMPVITPWEFALPEDAVSNLLTGYLPRQQEDKWFVFTDGPDAEGNATVHMTRSWTGYPIAEVKMKLVMGDDGQPQDFGAKFTEMTWESDNERIRSHDFKKAKENVISVCAWVLGIPSMEIRSLEQQE